MSPPDARRGPATGPRRDRATAWQNDQPDSTASGLTAGPDAAVIPLAFPQPLTPAESKALFRRVYDERIADGMEPQQAADIALDVHRVWFEGEQLRRRPAAEYRVIYRRAGWTQPKVRIYQRRHAAEVFMAKVRRPHSDYAPLVELRLEQRLVQRVWATVEAVAG